MTQGDRDLIEWLRAVDHMSVEECFLVSYLFAKAADRLQALSAENEKLREALIWADLKIRSLPHTDQSDVEPIRQAIKGT